MVWAMARLLTKFGTLPVSHHVPDVLQPGLDVVFCGTALGRMSAERKAYYANPGNLFWRALHRTGFTPNPMPPEAYAQVLQFGIGLTDLCKSAYGNDAELPQGALDVVALREKILRYQPRYLAFTSKAGAASYLGKDTGGGSLMVCRRNGWVTRSCMCCHRPPAMRGVIGMNRSGGR